MRRKGVDEAWDALEEMQRSGLRTDRFTVSRMLMKTLADARRFWDVNKVNRSVALVDRFIQQQPEEADEVLFNALLDTHCRMKDVPGLQATFQTMRRLGIQPSHVTLGILVKAYGQACDIKSVLRLWDEMVEQRQQANAVTYGCMINACVRCGQTEKALEIFNEMKRFRKHCNTILYTTLIKGYGNEKDLNHALSLFKEMKDEGVPYNTIAYNSIIDVCIKCSAMQAAEDIFREMIAIESSVQPDLITYSTLLKGYCQVGNLDKALHIAETIKAHGLKCDELVYNTLMDGCVKANDLSAGVGLFAEMMNSGMRPSSITHSIFLRLYQRNGYKGNASDAVAQLYQHHGLDRPHGLDKPSRGRGAKSKRGGAKPPDAGGRQGAPGPPPLPGQPVPLGYAPQAPGPARQAPLAQAPADPASGSQAAPPGRWRHVPSPSALLDGLGAASARLGQYPASHSSSYSPGIMSSPSTYGGQPMDRPGGYAAPPPYYASRPPHQGPPPYAGHPAAPFQQQGNGYNSLLGAYGPPPNMQEHHDPQFPSLLLHQRQQEEFFGSMDPDACGFAGGSLPGAMYARKPALPEC